MDELIYLDAAAATSIAPEVVEVMTRVMRTGHGNPSATHWAGRAAAEVIERGRGQVAALLGSAPTDVIFTSSATESNNLVLRGLKASEQRNEVVASSTEHPSVLGSLEDLGAQGRVIRLVPVDKLGRLDLDALHAAVSSRTALVSIHAANNETGVLQPIDEAAGIAHAAGALMHSDASQLLGWGPSTITDHCDLATVSSHKMHGPQGISALIASREARRRLTPLLSGGGQERGLRSGTVSAAGVAGFGAAAELARTQGPQFACDVRRLRVLFSEGLRRVLPKLVEHGAGAERLPGILSVGLRSPSGMPIEADAVLARLPQLAASTGSACHAGAPEPSPVLLAMQITEELASASIRLSLSRYSRVDEVDRAVSLIDGAVKDIRDLSSQDPRSRAGVGTA